MSEQLVIGIDLGTTQSLVGGLVDGDPVLFPGPDGDELLPSVVGAEGDRVLVGRAARNRRLIDPSGTVVEVKRAMGQSKRFRVGAREMSAAGIESSLYAGNRRSVAGFTACGDSREPLLFDPQTSGGLLAGVPAEEATDVVSKLRAAGYEHAAVVGHVTETGGISVR